MTAFTHSDVNIYKGQQHLLMIAVTFTNSSGNRFLVSKSCTEFNGKKTYSVILLTSMETVMIYFELILYCTNSQITTDVTPLTCIKLPDLRDPSLYLVVETDS